MQHGALLTKEIADWDFHKLLKKTWTPKSWSQSDARSLLSGLSASIMVSFLSLCEVWSATNTTYPSFGHCLRTPFLSSFVQPTYLLPSQLLPGSRRLRCHTLQRDVVIQKREKILLSMLSEPSAVGWSVARFLPPRELHSYKGFVLRVSPPHSHMYTLWRADLRRIRGSPRLWTTAAGADSRDNMSGLRASMDGWLPLT